MVGDAQNRHERLARTVCGRLMAAPFVFLPDEWKPRPSKRREPADLAWACNNIIIILMYLAECQPDENDERSKQRFKKGMDHNLGQAGTAVRLRKNRPLAGRNAWHRFWPPWEEGRRIVVLSVVKTGSETRA